MQKDNMNVPLGGEAYSGYSDWKNWERFFQFNSDDDSYFRQEIGSADFKDKSVLEIGFGEGRFLAWAQHNGACIVGSELDSRAIDAARKHDIALVDGEIDHHATSHPSSYDLIAAFDVFEHLTFEQIDAYLAAISRMLKPEGVVILRYPNGQSPFGLAPQHGDVTHVTALSLPKLEQLVAKHGMATHRYSASATARGTGLVWAYRLSRKLARKIIGSILNFAFGQNIIWDAVVTHVLVFKKPL